VLSTARPGESAAEPISETEAASLFAQLVGLPRLVVALSGGPDSTALLVLLARWRATHGQAPELIAVTVDHGLRPGSAREAAAAKRRAVALGVRHQTLHWRGEKPQTGVQEAARAARYGLLGAAARRFGALAIATGHTLDDQAETVLFRLARGSGIAGLAGMAHCTALAQPGGSAGAPISLVRPLLAIPKARLIATLEAAGIPYASDPSNTDPRFARPRLRQAAAVLATEGLDHVRLATLAQRARRADAALDWAVELALHTLPPGCWSAGGKIVLPLDAARGWPAEILLRVLHRAVAQCGNEGPVELAKLETLAEALRGAADLGRAGRWRRTLAGAVVTLAAGRLTVEQAPPRRRGSA
jgi:tRNA(Ile)-lysidine synthase